MKFEEKENTVWVLKTFPQSLVGLTGPSWFRVLL